MEHTKFISVNHNYRSHKGPFNGKPEHRIAPKIVQVKYFFAERKGKEENWGKSESKQIRRNVKKGENLIIVWKKRSILFNFPYWEVCTHINSRYLLNV